MANPFSKLGWYWHRLRAMTGEEIGLRLRKKAYQWSDAQYIRPLTLELEPSPDFPRLPQREAAPEGLKNALRQDVADILAGKWKAFGHLPLKVDDPPKWQLDYLARKDFQSDRCAFKLNHREQPGNADIKVIWEPSRWYQLVRLAAAAYLLEDDKAAQKCIEWMFSWARGNKPFTGLNWTSGLESGLRLVQFSWIDALLSAAEIPEKTLSELRNHILPPHVWYTSRHRSFGSSANNHLIGELAGLIVASVRWPELSMFTQSLRELGEELQREVLLQFAPDGGNREEALGYHLFSWEFCWQAMEALKCAGVLVSPEVQERLCRAGEFYEQIKPCGDRWDYGDSDNAYVTPLFSKEDEAASEWWRWFHDSTQSQALRFWWGDFPHIKREGKAHGWREFKDSGYAIFREGDWFLRWDLSALGYLSMAPHGHLDALHISIWHRGEPIIIDPGTGAYYADKNLRAYLAGWSAHNGPFSLEKEFPKRRGTFLWERQHAKPTLSRIENEMAEGEFSLPNGVMKRKVSFLKNGFKIEDSFDGFQSPMGSTWKFGPQAELRTDPIRLTSSGIKYLIFIEGWEIVKGYSPEQKARQINASTSKEAAGVPFDSLISPGFRKVIIGPYLKLKTASGRCSLRIVLE